MSYKPMTAEEAAKLSLRDEGTYAFEVLEAQAATSKEKSNPMIALTLRFFDASGDGSFTVKDWLVHSESRWSEKKIFDFANTTGLQAKYADGTMTAEDCLGRNGFAVIGVEKGKEKGDGSGVFPDRNKVKYYTLKPAVAGTPQTANSAPPAPTAAQEKLDEDVPF